MDNNSSQIENFYRNLKTKLEEHHNFPENYLYKFILPNEEKEKLSELYQIFDSLEYSINTKESSNGKYISISISCFVLDAEQVVSIYQKVAKIEGIIML